MARSPPPAAINSSMAASSGSSTSSHLSDLPLRNFSCSPDPGANLASTDSSPSLSNPAPAPSTLPLPTPSSVIAEFGDDSNHEAPSAVDMTERVFQSYSRSRSRSGGSSEGETRGTSRSSTPAPRRSPTESRSRSLQRREPNSQAKALNEKVHRFLHSITQKPAVTSTEEVLNENRSLHQRIAALQRTERDLLNDNQELARRLSSSHKRHDARRQQWKEELLNREKVYEARIKDLESRLARQEEEIIRIALDRSKEVALSDNAIASWLSAKGNAWRTWAEDFAHRDRNRVQSGLHPLQLRELCEGVKHFVQLTDNGELPEELLTPAANDGIQTAQVLLHGMLANFITSEILGTPFWAFDVISARGLELESPSVPRVDSVSPAGFRVDLATWNASVAPPPSARLPNSQDLRKLPRLVTSVRPPDLPTAAATGLLDQPLPSRQEMEGFYHVLSNVRGGSDNARAWRSSVMKALYDGGMSTEVDNAVAESTRVVAEARQQYAARLKDIFLRGPARFLLQDQDATGIEKLERRLIQEIDAALRFSCQLWCRRDTPRVRDLSRLPNTTFKSSHNYMELCQGHAPLRSPPTSRATAGGDVHRGYHDGHPIIMVVQPAVEVEPVSQPKVRAKIWAKAKVMVATPRPLQERPATGEPEPSNADLIKAIDEILNPATPPPPVPPKDSKNSALVLLPSIAFKDAREPSTKQPPSLFVPFVEPQKSAWKGAPISLAPLGNSGAPIPLVPLGNGVAVV